MSASGDLGQAPGGQDSPLDEAGAWAPVAGGGNDVAGGGEVAHGDGLAGGDGEAGGDEVANGDEVVRDGIARDGDEVAGEGEWVARGRDRIDGEGVAGDGDWGVDEGDIVAGGPWVAIGGVPAEDWVPRGGDIGAGGDWVAGGGDGGAGGDWVARNQVAGGEWEAGGGDGVAGREWVARNEVADGGDGMAVRDWVAREGVAGGNEVNGDEVAGGREGVARGGEGVAGGDELAGGGEQEAGDPGPHPAEAAGAAAPAEDLQQEADSDSDSDFGPEDEDEVEWREAAVDIVVDAYDFPMVGFCFVFVALMRSLLHCIYSNNCVLVRGPLLEPSVPPAPAACEFQGSSEQEGAAQETAEEPDEELAATEGTTNSQHGNSDKDAQVAESGEEETCNKNQEGSH